MDDLLRAIEVELYENFTPITVQIPYAEGQLISLFHEQGQVSVIEHQHKGVYIQGFVPGRLVATFTPYRNIKPDEPEDEIESEDEI